MAHILVIEQEIALLKLISSILRQDGYRVTEAPGPEQAVSIVERLGRDIDMVLIDVDMTPVSGFEFVKRITRDGIDIPLLFTTNSSKIAGAIAAMFGDHAVIEKSVITSVLRGRVEKFLTGYRHCSIVNQNAVADAEAA